MKCRLINAMGEIIIDTDVIAKLAGTVAMECFGIVGMASVNMKDGFVKLLRKDNLTHGISVSVESDKLCIDFHVIVSYGVSIATVSDNLIENVKYRVEEFTGLEVDKINIYVEGVRVID
ncbi:MAG: Asp23/Gls24 family envelope stress response protein [Lachnospiraceae bacterium]|nr:Asp23/Gls24 family envelope stress response protein [Lachnospiraceae bacterium]